MRELSIRLFQNTMGLVVGAEKKKMKKEVWDSLVPLLFHLHDQDKSVAKVGFPTCPLGNADTVSFKCVSP